MKRSLLVVSGILAAAVPLSAQTLTGAGATFPNPIYTKWFDAYNKKTGIQKLSVDRIRRRHPPIHRGYGGLRGQRQAHERVPNSSG
ncbi:MAG TPA: hypothetical protein VFZ90_11435 [Gemmatimonadales bacterium]